MSTDYLLKENVFRNKWIYDDAERAFYCKKTLSAAVSSLSTEFAKVREQLRTQLGNVESTGVNVNEITNRLNKLELENNELKNLVKTLEARIAQLEKGGNTTTTAAPKPAPAPAPAKAPVPPKAPAPAPSKKDDDDDFDLFGDDNEEESEERKRINEERVKAYNDKKAKKEAVIAKSIIILDVKPWDDETDMKKLEESVRSIEMDGLVWKKSSLKPVAFKIQKLQIECVIEDEKVSTEVLTEKICEFEDFVQSADISSFNKYNP